MQGNQERAIREVPASARGGGGLNPPATGNGDGAVGPAQRTPDGVTLNVPALTISEASFVCRRSRSTIRRRLEAGGFPNARRAFGDGPWLIPIPDLAAAGFRVGHDFALEAPAAAAERVAQLEKEVAVLRERLSAAQALAGEREDRILDFRAAFRVLEESNGTGPARVETLDRLADLDRKLRILIHYVREGHEQHQALPRGRRRWWPWRRR